MKMKIFIIFSILVLAGCPDNNNVNYYDSSFVMPGQFNNSQNARLDTRGNMILPGMVSHF